MSDNVCYQVSSSINRHKFKGSNVGMDTSHGSIWW